MIIRRYRYIYEETIHVTKNIPTVVALFQKVPITEAGCFCALAADDKEAESEFELLLLLLLEDVEVNGDWRGEEGESSLRSSPLL